MNFFSVMVLLCALSAIGIGLLFGLGFYFAGSLKKEKIVEKLISSKPFFRDFGRVLAPLASSLGRALVTLMKWNKKIVLRVGKYSLPIKKAGNGFLNYVHGRHLVKKKICEGYWSEVNGCKKTPKK